MDVPNHVGGSGVAGRYDFVCHFDLPEGITANFAEIDERGNVSNVGERSSEFESERDYTEDIVMFTDAVSTAFGQLVKKVTGVGGSIQGSIFRCRGVRFRDDSPALPCCSVWRVELSARSNGPNGRA